MQLYQLISKNHVVIDSSSHSKTAVLLKISQLLSEENQLLKAQDLFDAYWKRESLGSTTVGHGVMIPHIRCSSLQQTRACFVRLLHPVDFGAVDKQPVDLVIGLLVPENQPEQHLKMLSSIIKQVSCPEFRKAARHAACRSDLYSVLTNDILAPAIG